MKQRKQRLLIDGVVFIVTIKDSRVRTILGYPTREIEKQLTMSFPRDDDILH